MPPDHRSRSEFIQSSLDAVARWVEGNDYRAYDPGDGQLSVFRPLTFGHRRLEQLLTASVLRMPFNVRPLLGIGPHTSSKGMGYMAWGYVKRYALDGRPVDAEKARHCLDWLLSNTSSEPAHKCWGNAFTFTTRAGRIPAGTPTIVWSSLIGQAMLDAYLELGDERYLDAADSVCSWILTLPRERTVRGTCLSYVAFDQVSIHNSNMLGAALLARVGTLKGRSDAVHLAYDAMSYSCSRQNDDGGWYYGEAAKYHWIDSFHTGYNLDSLRRYRDATRDVSFDDCVDRGYAYFTSNFFEPDGRVRYMHDRLMPIDIQCCAQAIDTLAFFSDTDAGALDVAGRVADWTIRNMQASDGHFYYRDLGWTKTRTPMLHWGQGTMFKALSHLAVQLARGRLSDRAGSATPQAQRG